MRVPRVSMHTEPLIVVPASVAAVLWLPPYRGILTGIGIPLLWLWYCSCRRKWRAAETTPPTWEARWARIRDEFRLSIGACFLCGVAFGVPWCFAVIIPTMFGLTRWWKHTGRKTLAARSAFYAAKLAEEHAEALAEQRAIIADGMRVRPRRGMLFRASGKVEKIEWVETAPDVFVAHNVDGVRMSGEPGDQFSTDVLGPGQVILLSATPHPFEALPEQDQ